MIFCVEDDDSIQSLELYTLRSAGFEVSGFMDGDSFLKALRTERPDLVILDVMLPGISGVDLLKQMKASNDTRDIPVIMATAKGAEYDKIKSLDLGADDYLVKPFGMMEMVSRVKAVLRRGGQADEEKPLRMGTLELNPQTHMVFVQERRVELTLKEYNLLLTFLKNPGLVFTRNQLLELVWGEDYIGETRTVDVHVGTLRTKLGVCGDLIETVRGVGYRMGGRA